MFAASVMACTSPATVKKEPQNASLLDSARDFYSFLENRRMGNRHNDRDQRFRQFFPNRPHRYNFLDTYLPLARDRNFLYNRYNAYYIRDIEIAENGDSAEVKVKLYSRDAPLLYRKLAITHNWFKTGDTWYPGKVEGKMLTRWTKLTRLYALPPKSDK